MSRKSGLSAEQRLEAVLSLLRREEPAKQIARRYGVSEQSLYRWREDFLDAGKHGLKGKSSMVRCKRKSIGCSARSNRASR